jgi:hypothetical protein
VSVARRLRTLEQQFGADPCSECGGPPLIVLGMDGDVTGPRISPCGARGRPIRVETFTIDLSHPRDDGQADDAH